jgi:hypothetical protein
MKKGEKYMSFISEPPVSGLIAEFVVAIATIILGMALEKGKKDRFFVIAYIYGFILMLITSSFDVLVLPFLLVYSTIGIIFAFINWKPAFGIFGSKIYGSLLFTIACFHTQPFQQQFNTIISAVVTQEEATVFFEFYYMLLFVGWVLTAVIVWVLNRKITKAINKLTS